MNTNEIPEIGKVLSPEALAKTLIQSGGTVGGTLVGGVTGTVAGALLGPVGAAIGFVTGITGGAFGGWKLSKAITKKTD